MNKGLRVAVALCLMVVGLLFTGCATYSAKGVMPTDTDRQTARQYTKSQDGITVTVMPLTTKEETKKYFDENFLREGVSAIFLEIKSEIEKTKLISATLDTADAPASVNRGRTPEMIHAPAMDKDYAYYYVKRVWLGRAIFWCFFGHFIGAPISAAATYYVNTNVEEDLNGGKLLILPTSEIGKEPLKGFACFQVSDYPLVSPLHGVLKLLFDREGKKIEMEYELPLSLVNCD